MTVEWVSVSDGMPDEYERVLVVCRSKRGISSHNIGYFDSKQLFHGMGSSAHVTHWMRLPSIPGEIQEEMHDGCRNLLDTLSI